MVQMQKREKVVAVRQNKEATDEEKTNLRTHGAALNRERRVKLHLKAALHECSTPALGRCRGHGRSRARRGWRSSGQSRQ